MVPNVAVDCPICYEPLNEEASQGHDQVTLPCFRTHVFGRKCIAAWLIDHSTCPTCRAEVPQDFRRSLQSAPALLWRRCTKVANAAYQNVFIPVVGAGGLAPFLTVVTDAPRELLGFSSYSSYNNFASVLLDLFGLACVGFKVAALTSAIRYTIAHTINPPDTCFWRALLASCIGTFGAFIFGYPVVASYALGIGCGLVPSLNQEPDAV